MPLFVRHYFLHFTKPPIPYFLRDGRLFFDDYLCLSKLSYTSNTTPLPSFSPILAQLTVKIAPFSQNNLHAPLIFVMLLPQTLTAKIGGKMTYPPEDLNEYSERRPRPTLRIERHSHFLLGFSLVLFIITFVMGMMQVILSPFFSGFFSQSIGGMGLK